MGGSLWLGTGFSEGWLLRHILLLRHVLSLKRVKLMHYLHVLSLWHVLSLCGDKTCQKVHSLHILSFLCQKHSNLSFPSLILCVCVCAHARARICVWVCLRACVLACTCVLVCTHMHMCVCWCAVVCKKETARSHVCVVVYCGLIVCCGCPYLTEQLVWFDKVKAKRGLTLGVMFHSKQSQKSCPFCSIICA